MSEKDFNLLFSKNLNYYLQLNGKTQLDLAKYLGASASAVSAWCRGMKTPRMDKVDAMCEYFQIRRADLMEDKSVSEDSGYYLNTETATIAQQIFDSRELRSLFDAAKDASPEDLQTTQDILLALKRKERRDD